MAFAGSCHSGPRNTAKDYLLGLAEKRRPVTSTQRETNTEADCGATRCPAERAHRLSGRPEQASRSSFTHGRLPKAAKRRPRPRDVAHCRGRRLAAQRLGRIARAGPARPTRARASRIAAPAGRRSRGRRPLPRATSSGWPRPAAPAGATGHAFAPSGGPAWAPAAACAPGAVMVQDKRVAPARRARGA